MEPTYPSSYQARGIVLASRREGRLLTDTPFPSFPREDLVFRGGRTLPHLTYKTFYVGKVWTGGALAAARQNLDSALAAAMSDAALNDIVGQYFGGAAITTTALPSAVLDTPVADLFDKGDIHALANATFMAGALSGVDLRTCVFNFVLPPGAVLSSDGGGAVAASLRSHQKQAPGTPEIEEETSRHGLGGYHGSIHVGHPGAPSALYYSAAVWSEDGNGIALPGWEPWENACATLYHELNEARTDPDIEDTIRTGDPRWIGWNSGDGREIGDFPIEEAGPRLTLVFKKVPVAGAPGGVAPIQLLWSNRVHGPEAPGGGGVPMNAVRAAAGDVVTLAAGPSVAPQMAAAIKLSTPGRVQDFKKATSAGGWSALLSGLFDDSVRATQAFLKGMPSQFFNPAKGVPAGTEAELPIKWPGFPRKLENSSLPPDEAMRRAELVSGTSIGRFRFQDEYLEWFVTRVAGKITRIDFTCEGPEYWEFLASEEPDVLLELYQKLVSPKVKLGDLIVNGQYHPLNPWNTRHGAVHLIQPNNTLGAEIRIAADATILRRNADGSLKTDAQDLIQCAMYGDPGRASDPHIGDLVNGLAREGFVLSLTDPVGLYMSRPRLTGFATPDGKAIGQDWFKVTRGSEPFTLHGVFEAPAGSAFKVGDLSVGGVPLKFGGQVAKVIDMGLTGMAFGKGSIKSPAFSCGGPPLSGAVVTDAIRRSS